MSKISPCFWFDGQAEDAARFYVDTFKDGSIGTISYYPQDNPFPSPFPPGSVMLVDFTLFGQTYQALNGGPIFTLSEAVSLSVLCKDQAELDRYFDALTGNGGSPQPCGWVKDRFGLSWQLIPESYVRIMESGDAAGIARAMNEVAKMSKLDIAVIEAAFEGEKA